MVSAPKDEDPLTLALKAQIPENETPEERSVRVRAEEHAKQISAAIDDEIKADRAAMKRDANNVYKILLLGQAESGKSTTLKNFQMMFTPKAFAAELAIWKPLIHLNLIRSILVILDNLSDDPSKSDLDVDNFLSYDPTLSMNSYSRRIIRDSNQELLGAKQPRSSEDSQPYPGEEHFGPMPTLSKEHMQIKMRLSPLAHLQEVLMQKLAGQFGDENPPQRVFDGGKEHFKGEFLVRANSSWKGLLGRRERRMSIDQRPRSGSRGSEEDEVVRVLHACRDDMIALWNDPVVREILHRRDVRLEEGPGFFLHETSRIAHKDYVPTDVDVLRARVRTLGVQEYRFILETGPDVGREWRIYDVGGSRAQRAAWAPFFDDCHIIFLAPVSCFDQVLAEDRRVNRVEDSLLLWKAINSSKLLEKVELVLFMNKCDILNAKLKSGAVLKDYVPIYEGANTMEGATKFFRHKFRAIQKTHSPRQRMFYCHLTAVTDPSSTRKILLSIQEIVVRAQLTNVQLL